jgi:hypothetical protein
MDTSSVKLVLWTKLQEASFDWTMYGDGSVISFTYSYKIIFMTKLQIVHLVLFAE